MSLTEILKRCESTAEFLDEPITDVNQKGISGDTPLHIVAGWGDLEGLNELLAAGADVDSRGDLGRTPIFAAIGAGHLAAVSRLLEAGASVCVTDEHGVSPLQCAEHAGFHDIAQLLRSAH